MSSRLAESLIATAGVAVFCLLADALYWLKYGRSQGRLTAAERYAEEINLALPPEYAERLGRRLHRRTMAGLWLGNLVLTCWTFWFCYTKFLAPEPAVQDSGPPVAFMALWAAGGLIIGAGHVWDLMRSSRETGSQVARIIDPPVSDAVPPVLTWLVRAAALLPAVAASTWLLAPAALQHGRHAVHPYPLAYAAAVLLGPLCVYATEAVQRRILRSRQHAATAWELAFDDALRVQTTLAVMIFPYAFCVAVAIAIAAPLGRHDSGSGWAGARPVDLAMMIGGLTVVGVFMVLQSKRARRYYLRRFATYSASPPPSPPPVVSTC